MIKTFLVAVALTLIAITSTSRLADAQEIAAIKAISSLDLAKYQGQWFEIAKYPNRFQSMCVKATKAQYAVQEGGVSVLNSCVTDKGERTEVLGAARATGQVNEGKLSPAQLEVAFAPTWLRWLPMVWGKYWVVAIDPDYRWSLVTEPAREFAWILARQTTLSESDKTAVMAALKAAGLDANRLEWTKHN